MIKNIFCNSIYFKIYTSVCMDNVYKKSIDQFLFKNDSITVDDLENLVKENTWKKNETFFFVSYPTPKVGGFPCLTTKDSVDPSKPCMFPAVWYDGREMSNCSIDDSDEAWCLTKLGRDRRMYMGSTAGRWGLCKLQCRGNLQIQITSKQYYIFYSLYISITIFRPSV